MRIIQPDPGAHETAGRFQAYARDAGDMATPDAPPFETMAGGAGFVFRFGEHYYTVVINRLAQETPAGSLHSIMAYTPRPESGTGWPGNG